MSDFAIEDRVLLANLVGSLLGLIVPVPLLRDAVDHLGPGYAWARARDGLRVLNTVLEPLHASPGVVELRGRLAVTAA